MNGTAYILAANSRESFIDSDMITEERAYYGGNLAVATLNVVNESRNVFGRAKAVITIHDKCKLMLLPIPPSFQLLVGLVIERSVNAEDHKIANEIEVLVADILELRDNC